MLLSKALLSGLRGPVSRHWLVLSLAVGAVAGCGQTGPLYLPPEPVEPAAEIDTVVDAEGVDEDGAETAVEHGIEAGTEADLEDDLGGPVDDEVGSDRAMASDEEVVIEPEDDAVPAAGPE